jgi:hypothetical protein
MGELLVSVLKSHFQLLQQAIFNGKLPLLPNRQEPAYPLFVGLDLELLLKRLRELVSVQHTTQNRAHLGYGWKAGSHAGWYEPLRCDAAV